MVKNIKREELRQLISQGAKFKLVDVLSAESFEREHIKGAISLPLAEIEKMAAGVLSKNEKIVVYCASFSCPASTQAAEKLIALGYTDVWDYKGGLQDYKQGNLTLEGRGAQKAACANC